MTTSEPVYLTTEGVESLREELEHLVNVKRPALAERLRRAIQQGDISENADYQVAKEEQGFLEGRIRQIEVMLQRTILIDENNASDKVTLGTRVTVLEDGYSESETFQIVGAAEADPLNGRVSNESPLGKALLGHHVGDTITVQAPGGETVFQITAIA